MTALNRDKGAPPLYQQIHTQLRTQIERGDYPLGDLIPAEAQLEETFRVSRITVRQALGALCDAGYVSRRRGVGTIVTYGKIDETAGRVVSFSQDMARRGIAATTSHCQIETAPCPRPAAAWLRLAPDAPAHKLTRVRCVQAAPLVCSVSYLSPTLALSYDPAPYRESLYAYLQDSLHIIPVQGQDSFEAVAAGADEAALLGVELGAPLLQRTRCTYDAHGDPLEYTICHYVGGRYKYTVKL